MDLPDRPPRRVSIVGSTGTGKTTFGRELASALGVPFVELDALNWGPGWRTVGADVFQGRVREAMASDAWVVDGNYGGQGVREIVWDGADTIIWLDYGLPVIFVRLWRRTMDRIQSGTELWPGTGNRESFGNTFFSRESLFWWALKTHWRRKRYYSRLLALPQYAHITKLRFRRTRDADRWLQAQRTVAARISTERGYRGSAT